MAEAKSFTEITRDIKKRDNPKDVFITPLPLAKKQIDFVKEWSCYDNDDVWFDPFRNDGSYYNQFPIECHKDWTEILDDKDFFKFEKKINIICSNPPYSILDKVIKKSIELKPRIISYLIGLHNLTARRMEMFNNAGYSLVGMHMCKVFKWFGMSVIVQFERKCGMYDRNIISYDRTIWR